MCAVVTSGIMGRDKKKRTLCPYTECPYKVLDKYDTYEDYLKSEDSEINFAAAGPGELAGYRMTEGSIDKYGHRLLRTALSRGGKW